MTDQEAFPNDGEPAEDGAVQPVTFGRQLGTLWAYTGLRVGIFLVLWGLLFLVGVGGFLAAVIALILSIPLSYALLRGQRAALSATIEQRIAYQMQRRHNLDVELDPDSHSDGPE